MTAQFDSKCPACGTLIYAGAQIRLSATPGYVAYVHEACPSEAIPC